MQVEERIRAAVAVALVIILGGSAAAAQARDRAAGAQAGNKAAAAQAGHDAAGAKASDDAAGRSRASAGCPAPIRQALASIDLAPADFCFDHNDRAMYGGDRWKLPIFDALIDRPFRIPGDVAVWQTGLVQSADRASDLFTFATTRLGTGVRRGLIDDPVDAIVKGLPPANRLASAVLKLDRSMGKTAAAQDSAALIRKCAPVPDSLSLAIAVIIAAEAATIPARDAAFSALDPKVKGLGADAIRYIVGSDAGNLDPTFLRHVEEPAGAIDFPLWNAGIADLLLAIEKEMPLLRRHAAEMKEPLRIDTAAGAIVLSTAANDRHEDPNPLLVVDAGGNDAYTAGAAGTYENPISLIIDLGGDDAYAAADTLAPAFGAGVLGTGILIDDGGNDTYRGGHVSLGAGMYGVGILLDRDGNDTYDGLTATQGSGLFGVGILADAAGNDRYHAFQQAQGFGYVKGCGVLVDRAGNDVYVADDEDIRFPSAQSNKHNTSLSQGFGFGKRSDYVDGHSQAGGFGILVDGAGDDQYKCGVFGQGGGYWYGIGILADAQGNDSYEGVWYVQGAAAHFALGILWEGSGDDHYRATMNMAQGAGHDFSLGLLYEQDGNDRYDAPNLSLGGGNANGIGFFWDVAGDDSYNVDAATTLGRANIGSRGGMRDRMDTIGLFVDTGGKDTYPTSKEFAGDDRSWTQRGIDTQQPLDVERGAGIDTDWKPGDEPGWRTRRGLRL
jgi:hypothetical protein